VRVEGYEVYVPSMEMFGGEVTDMDITGITNRILQDVRAIEEYLVNNDMILNKPLEAEQFARTDDSYKCTHCRFLKVCNGLKKFEKNTLF
jgi:sulfatase maturation enzyme AslB (radical SAM superfamily)